MTDIRKHGFESDAQWREHLQEIEEATAQAGLPPVNEQRVLDELVDLRAEIAALREQIRSSRAQGRMTLWRRVGGAVAFLLLVRMAGR